MTMNAEKLTQKSAEAVRLAQSLATEHGNPQIEQVHLLAALLADDAGLIPQLLTAMGVTLPSFAAGVKDIMERQPRVTSSGHEPGKIYISADTEKALNRAEAAAGAGAARPGCARRPPARGTLRSAKVRLLR